MSSTRKQRTPFTDIEDERLTNLVTLYGSDWDTISLHMEGRNTRQVRERWQKYLDPNINKNPWTQEEDALLMQKFNEMGSQWKAIASYFPSRTDLSIRNRYKKLLRRIGKLERVSEKPKNTKKDKQNDQITDDFPDIFFSVDSCPIALSDDDILTQMSYFNAII